MRIIEEQNILQELFERFILFEESASYNENCNRFHIHRLQLLFILTSTFFCNYVLSSNKMLRVYKQFLSSLSHPWKMLKNSPARSVVFITRFSRVQLTSRSPNRRIKIYSFESTASSFLRSQSTLRVLAESTFEIHEKNISQNSVREIHGRRRLFRFVVRSFIFIIAAYFVNSACNCRLTINSTHSFPFMRNVIKRMAVFAREDRHV